MKDLTPKKMVEVFDRYVYGQRSAKAILAVAMRNRWRLTRMPKDQRLAVVKQNILLSGPTGSGKTALMRVLKNHFGLPVIEVDITQYTETGYVGKEVTSILSDLFELDIEVPEWYKVERKEQEQMDALASAKNKPVEFIPRDSAPSQEIDNNLTNVEEMSAAVKIILNLTMRRMYGVKARWSKITEEGALEKVMDETIKTFEDQAYYETVSVLLKDIRVRYPMIVHNVLMQRNVKAAISAPPGLRRTDVEFVHFFPIYGDGEHKYTPWHVIMENVRAELSSCNSPGKKRARLRNIAAQPTWPMKFRVACGEDVLSPLNNLINTTGSGFGGFSFNPVKLGSCDVVKRKFIEDYGVVFVDEIDKLAEAQGESSGRDRISRTGVQRSLLKALEGEESPSRNTTNILWIGAGSFANAPISGLMPEIQGRMPLRAVIEPLDRTAYCNILKLPTSVFHSSKGLLEVENINVIYDDMTFEKIAEACEVINKGTDDLGARRLGDIVYEAFMKPFFDPEQYRDGYDISGNKLDWLVEHYRSFVTARKNVLVTTTPE